MAQFILNVADADVPRVTAALCSAGGFPDVTVENALASVQAWIADTVVAVEHGQAQQAALAALTPPAPPVLS
jgi:hypothetical protein